MEAYETGVQGKPHKTRPNSVPARRPSQRAKTSYLLGYLWGFGVFLQAGLQRQKGHFRLGSGTRLTRYFENNYKTPDSSSDVRWTIHGSLPAPPRAWYAGSAG
jgi:hypothetical protein